jgi:hypothetical protein
MEEQKALVPWYQQPIWLGLLGLGLAIGGTMLSNYNPLTPRQAEQARKAAELQEMGEQQGEEEFGKRVERIRRDAQPQPPYRLPGQVLFFVGVGLFVVAAVLMFRAPAGNADDESGGAPKEEDGEHHLA